MTSEETARRFIWTKDDVDVLKRNSKKSDKSKEPEDRFAEILDKELSGVK